MNEVKVEFYITPPVDATDAEVREWIEYCVGDRGGININNPLCGYDLDIWENGKGLTIS